MAAKDDFDILDAAVKSGKQSVTLPDGRTFNLDEARTERDRLGKELKKQETDATFFSVRLSSSADGSRPLMTISHSLALLSCLAFLFLPFFSFIMFVRTNRRRRYLKRKQTKNS